MIVSSLLREAMRCTRRNRIELDALYSGSYRSFYTSVFTFLGGT